jgi:WD40 repeat protein/energy-coupling factor transporter ATP-binding protein EcfA2
MARTVFLSHAGADTAAADALRKRLEGAGFDVWFDKRDLRAGHEVWQKQLEAQIDKVDGFVVYVGTGGVVNWVEAETRYALSRAISGKRKLAFVPVLSAQVKGGSKALPGFARQFQAVRDVENDPGAWNCLVTGLKNGAPPPKEEHPFFQLKPISADRNHLFFGRRHETAQIIDILRDRNLVLVAGASGSGKSSLVRAGLIPAWRGNAVGVRRGEHPEQGDWLTITMTPGDSPWENLGKAVIEAAEQERGLSPSQAAEFATLAQNDDPVVKERALRLNADPDKARVLLVVDQFEELFVRKSISPETRRSFAEFLARLADPRDPAFAVALTMRGDYTNHLANDPGAASLQARLQAHDGRARFTLRSILMSDPDNPAAGTERLRQVVTGPLALAQWPVAEAEALADMVLRDAGGDAGDLALVQFALSETWAQRGNNGNDLLRSYASVGRVEGALAKSADEALNALVQNGLATEADAEAALIRLGSLIGTSPLRRTAHRSEFTAPRWEALQFLASEEGRRLVQITGEGDAATVEIAHEALLTQWKTLNGWLSRDPEGKRLLDGFVQRAREVADAPPARRPRARSLREILMTVHNLTVVDPGGPVLSADDAGRYEKLVTDHRDWLTPAEADLLHRSKSHAEAMHEREERLPRVMAGWVGTLAAASLMMTVLLGVAFYLWFDSRASERLAAENAAAAMAGLSEVAIERGNDRRGAILALAALASSPSVNPSTRIVAIFDVANARAADEPLRGHEDWVSIVAVSADGRRIVSGDGDGTLRLWSATTGAALGEPLRGHEGRVWSVDISPDGRRIVSGGEDNTLRLWDATTGAVLGEPLLGYEGQVRSVAFSPDGGRIVSASNDCNLAGFCFYTLRLWDASTGASLGEPLRGHLGALYSVVFSPDGSRFVSGGSDGALRLWDAAIGVVMGEPLRGHEDSVSSVAFSPDGSRIVSGGEDGTLRLWDASTGAALGEPLRGHGGSFSTVAVSSVAFSPDGSRIVSGGWDNTLRLWDATTYAELGAPLRGNESWVTSIAFSPDGSRIVSGGADGTLRLWDVARYFGLNRIRAPLKIAVKTLRW